MTDGCCERFEGVESLQYATLTINTIVMHELLAGTAKGLTPQLSDAPTDAPEADRAFIQERIRRTLPKDARPIQEDSELSPVPNLVKAYLQDPDSDPIAISQAIVGRLQASQHAVSPGGIFVFADATLDVKPALLIAKLEHHEGVRASPTTLPSGKVTFGVELLRDLLFTTGSRVFKVALFERDGIKDDILNGMLVDRQMAGSSVAQFFLTTFLGCRLAERADFLTEKFYDGAQSYINTVLDAEKRGRYEVALLSELQSQQSELSVLDFATQHLDIEDRDDFTHSMQGSGVPARTFDKNVGLIKNKVTKVKINTESGITVLAPVETVDNGVLSIESDPDDIDTITVKDRITEFK